MHYSTGAHGPAQTCCISRGAVSRPRDAANEAYQIDLIGIPQLMSDDRGHGHADGRFLNLRRGLVQVPAGLISLSLQ
jgi:hypothetical protein